MLDTASLDLCRPTRILSTLRTSNARHWNSKHVYTYTSGHYIYRINYLSTSSSQTYAFDGSSLPYQTIHIQYPHPAYPCRLLCLHSTSSLYFYGASNLSANFYSSSYTHPAITRWISPLPAYLHYSAHFYHKPAPRVPTIYSGRSLVDLRLFLFMLFLLTPLFVVH